jgi:hypothetical protein
VLPSSQAAPRKIAQILEIAVPAAPAHGEHLVTAHGLEVEAAKGEIDRAALGAESIAAHDALDELFVDFDVGACDVQRLRPNPEASAAAPRLSRLA